MLPGSTFLPPHFYSFIHLFVVLLESMVYHYVHVCWSYFLAHLSQQPKGRNPQVPQHFFSIHMHAALHESPTYVLGTSFCFLFFCFFFWCVCVCVCLFFFFFVFFVLFCFLFFFYGKLIMGMFPSCFLAHSTQHQPGGEEPSSAAALSQYACSSAA